MSKIHAGANVFKPSPLSLIIQGLRAPAFEAKGYLPEGVQKNFNRLNGKFLLRNVEAARHEPVNTVENAGIAAGERLAAAADAEREWSSFSAKQIIEKEANRPQMARETKELEDNLFRELNFQRALRQSYAKRNGSTRKSRRKNRRSTRNNRKSRSNRR